MVPIWLTFSSPDYKKKSIPEFVEKKERGAGYWVTKRVWNYNCFIEVVVVMMTTSVDEKGLNYCALRLGV